MMWTMVEVLEIIIKAKLLQWNLDASPEIEISNMKQKPKILQIIINKNFAIGRRRRRWKTSPIHCFHKSHHNINNSSDKSKDSYMNSRNKSSKQQ